MMSRLAQPVFRSLAALLLAIGLYVVPCHAVDEAPAGSRTHADDFALHIRPFLRQHCERCHIEE